MKRFLQLLTLLSACTSVHAQYQYPSTKTVDSSDTYFGTTIKDPHRWLENIKDSAVLNWFKAQADFTNKAIAQLPGQQVLINEMKENDKIVAAKYNPLSKAGGKYFYTKRLPGESVARLFYRTGDNGQELLLFDPLKYEPGKVMNFNADVSFDGSKVALNLSEEGSELGDVRIIDVASATLLEDKIPHGFGMFVQGSNSQLLYSQAKSYDTHDPEVFLNMPMKQHILGTPLSQDLLLVSAKKYPELNMKPSEFPSLYVYKKSPYIILGKSTVENYLELFIAPASELYNEHINWKPFTTKADEIWEFFVTGEDVYLKTSKNNPHFSVIKTSLKNPDFTTAQVIIKGNENWKLSTITQSKDYLVISKSKNELAFEPWVYELKSGKLREIKMPLKGNIEVRSISEYHNELIALNAGWNTPLNLFRYDLDKNTFSNGPFHNQINIPEAANIVYEEIEIPSHDGAMVPLSIVYDKTKLKKDGSNILFMQGYGSYGMSAYLPTFSLRGLPLLKRGVVLAFAHIRGGGEKGKDWYLAGKKTKKPNTWKDFNACAEYLIKNKYTSSEKLGISGASAGGILVGRAITERPDLYKVAIPKVGCLNALRMEFSPNGPANIPEFGTIKDSVEFRALLEMDAYHHIKKGSQYPAQLITTGFNDPRVESYIPAKFAAKMQAENGSSHPVLLYVDYKAGHFGGSTVEEQFVQAAREYSFLLWHCGYRGF